MTNGQARVLVLLLILLGLEILRMPALKTWFTSAWAGIAAGITGADTVSSWKVITGA